MILNDVVFKSEGLLWVVEKKDIVHANQVRTSIHHAACPREEIRVRLDYDESTNLLTCESCGFKKELTRPYPDLRNLVDKRYQGSLLQSAEV